MIPTRCAVPALLALVAACAGTGPMRALEVFLEESDLSAGAPVVLVDLDDTVFHRATRSPMPGAAAALRELARDHLVVYLTARPTHAKLQGLTDNRDDSLAFLREHDFPDGPLFTSSLWNLGVHGQGGGKVQSLEQLRAFGVQDVALAVGDRPHDLDAYLGNGHVRIRRAVVILIESGDELDPDREELPAEVLGHALVGTGSAWPRILSAYRAGDLPPGTAWVVSQAAP